MGGVFEDEKLLIGATFFDKREDGEYRVFVFGFDFQFDLRGVVYLRHLIDDQGNGWHTKLMGEIGHDCRALKVLLVRKHDDGDGVGQGEGAEAFFG